MAATQLKSLTEPSCFRAGTNASGTDIAAKRIVKWTSTQGQIDFASAVTDGLAGVSYETIYNGKSGSFQVDGRAVLTAGGTVNIGDDITTDSVGRGVTATQGAGATQKVIGRAVSAATVGLDFEIELKSLGQAFSSVIAVADRAALKAIAASSRWEGLLVLLIDDKSLWCFDADSALATDQATNPQLVIVPTAGDGRWIRANSSFIAKLPFTYATADGTAIWTIPEGFTVRLASLPYWEIAASLTGGSSSAIGIAASLTGYDTAGDILGGASGDVAATLVAGTAAGTIGPKLDTLTELQAFLLEEGHTLTFERITSAFTAGSGYVCVPVVVSANAPATP